MKNQEMVMEIFFLQSLCEPCQEPLCWRPGVGGDELAGKNGTRGAIVSRWM